MQLSGRTSASLVLLLACGSCREAPPKALLGFRDTYTVDLSTLKPEGTATYFPLVPGTVCVYRDGKETVTITVLEETRVVDGVTTRVVEEREMDGKELKEVSLNFFASEPATGDVYYFGEDVDIYEDGEITGHEGSWRSGVGGARFGLIMPGRPIAGDRYFQEHAPEVAMDRAEIVAVGKRVETPGRIFENCVQVHESSPLESGTSDKWYAPGIGLVRDGKSVIVPK